MSDLLLKIKQNKKKETELNISFRLLINKLQTQKINSKFWDNKLMTTRDKPNKRLLILFEN